MLRIFAGIAFLFFAASAAAHASTYTFTYTFSNTDPVIGDTNFVYTTTNLITSSETGTPSSCTAQAVGTCTTVEISPEDNDVRVNGTGGTLNGIEFGALPAEFFTLGTHSWGGSTLTITENVSTVASTPEPSSLLLLGTGILGTLGTLRRRFVRA